MRKTFYPSTAVSSSILSLSVLSLFLLVNPSFAENSEDAMLTTASTRQENMMHALFAEPSAQVEKKLTAQDIKKQKQKEQKFASLTQDQDPTFPNYAVIGQGNGRSQREVSDIAPMMSMDPKFAKQEVEFNTAERPGTIVVNTSERMLYLVMENGRALRYGIGVGRPGFTWRGTHSVTRKAEWPDWRPPIEMLKRRPDLPRFMAGGPENPLGARALYLGSTIYRIHGTNEEDTIGSAVSSGCFRMRNDDVTDLYPRVKTGAKVVVL